MYHLSYTVYWCFFTSVLNSELKDVKEELQEALSELANLKQ